MKMRSETSAAYLSFGLLDRGEGVAPRDHFSRAVVFLGDVMTQKAIGDRFCRPRKIFSLCLVGFGPARRSRFMAQLGAMMPGLFALLIAAQGAAYRFIDPCRP